jgi:DNA repair protein RadC
MEVIALANKVRSAFSLLCQRGMVHAPHQLVVRDCEGNYQCASPEEILQAARAVLDSKVRGIDLLNQPQTVKDYLQVRIGHLEYEAFGVMHLDSQHHLLKVEEMFRGSVSQTSVYPREVVREALASNSSAVILYHNHPSGSVDPSRADEHLTGVLRAALNLVDVRVLDHIVVSGQDATSFAERGLL